MYCFSVLQKKDIFESARSFKFPLLMNSKTGFEFIELLFKYIYLNHIIHNELLVVLQQSLETTNSPGAAGGHPLT